MKLISLVPMANQNVLGFAPLVHFDPDALIGPGGAVINTAHLRLHAPTRTVAFCCLLRVLGRKRGICYPAHLSPLKFKHFQLIGYSEQFSPADMSII